jgi:N-acetylmuramoyl-L-alanine amidase
MKTRKWNDVAYNFLIGSDGNVYEGRGWRRVGSHTKGFSSKSIAISFVGNFEKVAPKEEAIEACKLLIEW